MARWKGTIAEEPRGNEGFGYDPVFVPAGFDHTFAEMPIELKNQISHRARAVVALRARSAANAAGIGLTTRSALNRRFDLVADLLNADGADVDRAPR